MDKRVGFATMAETDQEKNPAKSDSADESEDEGEVLEESPCGRWQKRREEVEQRDVPGIDQAFLAMDTEEGVEVVWNEVQFSENRNLKEQQEKIRQVFANLIQLDHPNIVKFHKYWTDTKDSKPRVIFITEYMSSGSLKQFLKKTKKNNKTFQIRAWKRWVTQILSALSYLHSCDPPIIHGNLTCDTVFIQHNGLIKIGSVAPDAMHHVKTYREDIKNMHCVAPEYGEFFTTAIDIYSFGMCALEMAALGIQGNGGEGSSHISAESIKSTLEGLENPLQRVSNLPENMTDEALMQKKEPNNVVAEIIYKNKPGEPVQWKLSQCPPLDLEKFLEDVRLVTSMSCQVKKMEESSNSFQINIYLKMDDKMNRQLQAEVTETDTATALAQELVHYGFINESDREKIAKLIEDSLNPNMLQNESSPPVAMSVS
ncbi:hypothetical protein KUTeg_016131 [Tegillarca granosa]|uniref:Protein kinase domain-containing protein n=1 Tax=Tegillarca granosa TaxID=220873 RepID=A0ABQ9EK02_TEGGR|nr:hypothetical protein KUTeg_016131 [Tegillarca granosa]